MKSLKCWAWSSLALSLICFGIGFFGGEFNQAGGLYGTSTSAMLLSILSLIFLINAITVFLVHNAIKPK